MKPVIEGQAELFDRCASSYARYRPGYAAEALDQIIRRARLQPDDRVCDLGAGTGILSELLARRGLRVSAIEPLRQMRAMAKHRLADFAETGLPIIFRRGTAERIPLRDASVRAVFCGQSFHWFDYARALPEISRVLVPHGWLAVMWNDRETSSERWIARLEALMKKYNPNYRLKYRERDWKPVIESDGKFRVVAHRRFPTVERMSIPGILGLMDSFSYVQVVAESERRKLKREVRSMLVELLGPAPGRTILLPMQTDLYLAQRLEGERES